MPWEKYGAKLRPLGSSECWLDLFKGGCFGLSSCRRMQPEWRQQITRTYKDARIPRLATSLRRLSGICWVFVRSLKYLSGLSKLWGKKDRGGSPCVALPIRGRTGAEQHTPQLDRSCRTFWPIQHPFWSKKVHRHLSLRNFQHYNSHNVGLAFTGTRPEMCRHFFFCLEAEYPMELFLEDLAEFLQTDPSKVEVSGSEMIWNVQCSYIKCWSMLFMFGVSWCTAISPVEMAHTDMAAIAFGHDFDHGTLINNACGCNKPREPLLPFRCHQATLSLVDAEKFLGENQWAAENESFGAWV